MKIEDHLKLIGAVLCVLAIAHIAFPKRFQWRENLSGLSLINRQMMYAHTFFIALFVLMNGLLFMGYSKELTERSTLSDAIVTGLAVFWTVRALFQHAHYSSQLWRGKKFETVIHVFFSILWIYISVILFAILY